MGFPRQEYWSDLLFPSPGDLPDPRIEPLSPALAEIFFTTWKAWYSLSSGELDYLFSSKHKIWNDPTELCREDILRITALPPLNSSIWSRRRLCCEEEYWALIHVYWPQGVEDLEEKARGNERWGKPVQITGAGDLEEVWVWIQSSLRNLYYSLPFSGGTVYQGLTSSLAIMKDLCLCRLEWGWKGWAIFISFWSPQSSLLCMFPKQGGECGEAGESIILEVLYQEHETRALATFPNRLSYLSTCGGKYLLEIHLFLLTLYTWQNW